MQRHWVSWWSGYYGDEGCTEPPFAIAISGQRERDNKDPESERDECSFCAVVDSESEGDIWECINKYFPDNEPRFCKPVADDWSPGDRFKCLEEDKRGTTLEEVMS